MNEYTIDQLDAPTSTSRDVAMSAVGCVLIAFTGVVLAPQLRHWFMLPVTLCGIVIAADGIWWFRGGCDPFDPKGLVGVLGIHFFFTAPLLVALWEIRITYVGSALYDYRPYLGFMGAFNLIGILLYKWSQRWACSSPYRRAPKVWLSKPHGGSVPIVMVGVVIALMTALGLFMLHGGASAQLAGRAAAVTGGSLLGLFGQSLALLSLVLLTEIRRLQAWGRSMFMTVFIVLVILAAVNFLLFGLVGSRSRTVWAIFAMGGVIHFFWRPMSRKTIILAVVAIMAFMYMYGFYKSLRGNALRRMMAGESAASLAEQTGRTWGTVLIGDLSRADMQAYMMYVLTTEPHPYRYRWGETYAAHVAAKVPQWMMRTRFNTVHTAKRVAGREVQFGSSVGGDTILGSSRVYGLAGETMLNFGIWPIPLAFLAWGFLVGWCRRGMYNWRHGDTRFYLLPLITNLLIIMLISDSDNWMFFLLMSLLFPWFIIRTMSVRLRADALVDVAPGEAWADDAQGVGSPETPGFGPAGSVGTVT